MRASHAKWESELKGILNKNQFAKYEAERDAMRERASSRDHHQNKGKEYLKRKEARMQQQSS